MTTDALRRCILPLCAVLACVALTTYSCAGANSIRHGDSLDVSHYPSDIRAAYEVFAVRCKRCHTLARPLNARIHDGQHWVRYVNRMRLNPASGINEKNGQIILHFLLYYMHQQDQEQREHDEPKEEGPDTQPSSPPPTAAVEPAVKAHAAAPASENAAPVAEPVEPVQPAELTP
jgi:hypothetical protein